MYITNSFHNKTKIISAAGLHATNKSVSAQLLLHPAGGRRWVVAGGSEIKKGSNGVNYNPPDSVDQTKCVWKLGHSNLREWIFLKISNGR